jgi:hypothetical protein
VSYPIRQRPSSLVLLARSVIRAGLEAMIDALPQRHRAPLCASALKYAAARGDRPNLRILLGHFNRELQAHTPALLAAHKAASEHSQYEIVRHLASLLDSLDPLPSPPPPSLLRRMLFSIRRRM